MQWAIVLPFPDQGSGMCRRLALLSLIGLFAAPTSFADDALVAVASNFAPVAKELAAQFNEMTDHDVRLSSGSTGKLYAQILNGAPYDVFLSADSDRPIRLEQQRLIVGGSRFTYAVGGLLLWSRNVAGEGEACVDAFLNDRTSRIAIANPEIAPYGAAARDYLEATGLWEDIGQRLIVGENIAQTFQFVSAGGAAFGFIAKAQLGALPQGACVWQVPDTLYSPIRQQAVMLDRAQGNEAAVAFLNYLRGAGRDIILARGYTLENDNE